MQLVYIMHVSKSSYDNCDIKIKSLHLKPRRYADKNHFNASVEESSLYRGKISKGIFYYYFEAALLRKLLQTLQVMCHVGDQSANPSRSGTQPAPDNL